MLDSRLVFDGIKNLIDRYPEWSEVGLRFAPLLDSATHLDGLQTAEELWLRFFLKGNYVFGFSISSPCLAGVIGRGSSRLFYLDVLLSPDEDIPHLGDIIFHKMFVEGVGTCSPPMKAVVATSSLQLYTRSI